MGKAIKSITKPLKNAVFGASATDGGVVDTASPEQKAQASKVLGVYSEMLNNTDKGVQEQISAQEAQARGGAEDQQRLAQQLVAQRGLGNTAGGINTILGAQQGLSDKLGAIRAQAPGLKQQNLGFAAQGIGNILGVQNQSKMYQQGQAGTGGMLGSLVAGAAGGTGMGLAAKMLQG